MGLKSRLPAREVCVCVCRLIVHFTTWERLPLQLASGRGPGGLGPGWPTAQ